MHLLLLILIKIGWFCIYLIGAFIALNLALFVATAIWMYYYAWKNNLGYWKHLKHFFYYSKFALNTAYPVFKLTGMRYREIMAQQKKR